MKLHISGNYLKPSDAKKGGIITFLTSGELEVSSKYTYEDGTAKKSLVFDILYEKASMKIRVNRASQINLIEAYGDETEKWINKKARINIFSTPSGNNKMIVLEPFTLGASVSEGATPALQEKEWDA